MLVDYYYVCLIDQLDKFLNSTKISLLRNYHISIASLDSQSMISLLINNLFLSHSFIEYVGLIILRTYDYMLVDMAKLNQRVLKILIFSKPIQWHSEVVVDQTRMSAVPWCQADQEQYLAIKAQFERLAMKIGCISIELLSCWHWIMTYTLYDFCSLIFWLAAKGIYCSMNCRLWWVTHSSGNYYSTSRKDTLWLMKWRALKMATDSR